MENGKATSDLLVGLVSFGEFLRCESSEPIDLRKPAVFTRISDFQPWIEKVIAAGGQVEDEAESGEERGRNYGVELKKNNETVAAATSPIEEMELVVKYDF